jgi:hypothetical protein
MTGSTVFQALLGNSWAFEKKGEWLIAAPPSALNNDRSLLDYGQAAPVICPLLLLNVHVFVPQLACCAVN